MESGIKSYNQGNYLLQSTVYSLPSMKRTTIWNKSNCSTIILIRLELNFSFSCISWVMSIKTILRWNLSRNTLQGILPFCEMRGRNMTNFLKQLRGPLLWIWYQLTSLSSWDIGCVSQSSRVCRKPISNQTLSPMSKDILYFNLKLKQLSDPLKWN